MQIAQALTLLEHIATEKLRTNSSFSGHLSIISCFRQRCYAAAELNCGHARAK